MKTSSSRRRTSERAAASRAVVFIVALASTGCSPAADFDRRADALGLTRLAVAGSGFEHVVYSNNKGEPGTIHIYLDGDGLPAVAGWPASDPTPRRSLALDLLARDPAPSAYLGRPCYHGKSTAPSCSDTYWTSQRYSETVVASLASATRRILDAGSHDGIVWIGYSGGGVLAVLLAPRFRETRAVVTIAANLDIDAWADHHGYERLAESLNPAAKPRLPDAVLVRHHVGGRDRVVPPAVTAAGLGGRDADVVLYEGFDHVCCWREAWPDILARLAEDLAALD